MATGDKAGGAHERGERENVLNVHVRVLLSGTREPEAESLQGGPLRDALRALKMLDLVCIELPRRLLSESDAAYAWKVVSTNAARRYEEERG